MSAVEPFTDPFDGLPDALRSIQDTVEANFSDQFKAVERDSHPQIMAQPAPWTDPSTLPTRKFLYGTAYSRKLVSATVAPGGTGKTNFIVAEALAMVTGQPILGVRPYEKSRVWLWNGEDPMEEMQRRFFGACKYYGVTAEDIGDRVFINSGRQSPIVFAQEDRDGARIVDVVFDDLEFEIKNNEIDVLILDPFVSSHRVNENDNNKIDTVVKAFGTLADRCNCAIQLVHHVRKARDTEETVAEDARGASALVDGCRSVRALTRMSKQVALDFGVDDVRRRSMFRLGTGKLNIGPATGDKWFETVGYALHNGGNGTGDDVGIATQWEPPSTFSGLPPDALRRVQVVIERQSWRSDVRSPQWAGNAISEALGLEVATDEGIARVKKLLAAWLKSRALVEVVGLDEKGREKKFVGVGNISSDD